MSEMTAITPAMPAPHWPPGLRSVRATLDLAVEQEREGARDNQGREATDGGPRDVALRVVRLLGRQRQLLDGEVEPDGEWDGGKDARDSKGKEARVAIGGFDVDEEARV